MSHQISKPAEGRISRWPRGRGRGVSKRNIFFHATDVAGVPFRELRQGDPVSYVASFNDRGPCARRVTLVEELGQGEGPPQEEAQREFVSEPGAFLTFS